MLPTMYGMQSNAGYGSDMGSGMGSGILSQRRGNANLNRVGWQDRGWLAEDSLPSESKESYSDNQKGRFDDYGDYGSYDDGYSGYGVYGVDKASKSGFGAQSYGSYAGYGKQCPGVPISLLLISLLGVALMGYILWSKIVAAGRRKRDVAGIDDFWWFVENLGPILMNGVDQFEDKLDKLADTKDNPDWISQLYNRLPFPDVQVAGGSEPSILHKSWKHINTHANTNTNVTVSEAIPAPSTSCSRSTWQCLSKVIGESLHYLDKPQAITSWIKKVLYKSATHGRSSNIWSGLMQVKEIQHITDCLTAHEECRV